MPGVQPWCSANLADCLYRRSNQKIFGFGQAATVLARIVVVDEHRHYT
jgi:hypothetical protein